MVAIVFEAVDWWQIDPGEEGWPYYRHCDLCEHTATDDVCATPQLEPRRFVVVHGGPYDGCSVCEHCIANLEDE